MLHTKRVMVVRDVSLFEIVQCHSSWDLSETLLVPEAHFG